MPFTIIKGTFIPESGVPDGDTVRFMPDDPAPLYGLPHQGYSPRISRNSGTISLRYEGIDALEKSAREPFASNATNENRELLGVPNKNDKSRGYILTRRLGPYGRPISFVFTGDNSENDGSSVFLDTEWMQESINFQLVEIGAVYPLFYHTLFLDLREAIASAVVVARSNGVGLWPHDQTLNGVTWQGANSLPNLDPIFPKLWRRLVKYTQNEDFYQETNSLDAFIDFLRLEQDRLLILSRSQCTDLDNIIDVNGETIMMRFLPEDLVFL